MTLPWRKMLFAIALALAFSPAFAHDSEVDSSTQLLVIPGVVFGVAGGLLAGCFDAPAKWAFLLSVAGFALTLFLFIYIEGAGGTDHVMTLLMLMLWITVAGVLPLAISFFVSFRLATALRKRQSHVATIDDSAS